MVFIPDKRYYYTKDELFRLLKTMKRKNFRDYVLYKTLLLTGRRDAELVGNNKRGLFGLRPVDIDWNSSLVTWTLEKRGKWIKDEAGKRKLVERDREKIKASDEVLDMLKAIIELRKIGDYDRIFPMTTQFVNKRLHEYIKEVNIGEKKRVVHGLRHSYAIHILPYVKTGDDLRKLQKSLGHKRFASTEEYLKYKELDEKDLVEKASEGFRE